MFALLIWVWMCGWMRMISQSLRLRILLLLYVYFRNDSTLSTDESNDQNDNAHILMDFYVRGCGG